MITEFSSREMNGRDWQEICKGECGLKIVLVLMQLYVKLWAGFVLTQIGHMGVKLFSADLLKSY
jgi:hypothetical protein